MLSADVLSGVLPKCLQGFLAFVVVKVCFFYLCISVNVSVLHV